MTSTYQNMTDRVFEGASAKEAAEAFARLAGEQVGSSFPVSGNADYYAVDLDEWPDDEMFGDWFEALCADLDIDIVD